MPRDARAGCEAHAILRASNGGRARVLEDMDNGAFLDGYLGPEFGFWTDALASGRGPIPTVRHVSVEGGTRVLVEIGAGQLPALEERLRASPLHLADAWNDYSRIPRVLSLVRRH